MEVDEMNISNELTSWLVGIGIGSHIGGAIGLMLLVYYKLKWRRENQDYEKRMKGDSKC